MADLHDVDAPAPQASDTELIALVAKLAGELRGAESFQSDISLSSRLDRDLGIDSLGRMELVMRIERAFSVQLPIPVIGEVETVGDLLQAVHRSRHAPADLAGASAPVSLPTVPAATDAQTLTEVLDWHVAQHPDRLHVTVLQDERTVLAAWSYGDLARAARSVANGLLSRGISPGDRVGLMLPTGTDFFAAFFGILYAHAVPVPIYPPMQLTQIEEYARRQAGILKNASVRILVTIPEALRLGSLLRSLVTTIKSVESVPSLSVEPQSTLAGRGDGSEIALIQYTSGSTGDPKGVVLTHRNLLANIRAIGRAIKASSSDVLVSWLPLYHDMGLIGAWLGTLYFGAPFYVMSPLVFLARPQSWLWAIHRYRGTISAGPNFAFETCIEKISDTDLAGLDLGSLRYVANGAEPVSIPTLQRFTERLGQYGFRPEAMAPVYGLAENAVAVAMPPAGIGPIIERLSRKSLSEQGLASPACDSADTMEVVSCGPPIPEHEVRIVDERGLELGQRHEGRIEFRGPSATSGYFHDEAHTRALFHDGWLDTGDRGFMTEGQVFVTGRVKDIIIRAGQHIYPHEVEDAVGSVSGFHKGGVAAFGISDPAQGTERIVVVAETDEKEARAREALRARAQKAMMDAVGFSAEDLVLVAPGVIPKTQSGKIRRSRARDLYLSGDLAPSHRNMRLQYLRLSWAAIRAQASRAWQTTGELAYACWWWLVIGVSAVLGGLAVIALPKLSWRWATVRNIAKVALWGIGAPPRVIRTGDIPHRQVVFMFNHASYSDVLVLAAVLPSEPIYLAKNEFADQFPIGMMLRRLGVAFIERHTLSQSLDDIGAAIRLAGKERPLVIFPEGTFIRRSGLSGFFLGGFKIAAGSGLPIVPAALRGTRSMLRSDQWLPHKTAISVEFGDAVTPHGQDFDALLKLRDEVRRQILSRCGEPDLNELIKPATR